MTAPRALTLVDDRDVISALRALMPPARTISWSEAHSIAERQAALLLDLMHISEPPVPQFVISSLPGVVVDRRAQWPTSGMAVQARGHWRIVLRSDEPRQRQRFSLAHEFKHVIDDTVVDRLHNHLSAEAREERIERLCDYFAACLLMPRPWVKHDYYGGLQTPYRLARRYYVSTEAMSIRLSELGLTDMTLAVEPRVGARHREAA